eukprot:3852168-Rhodomonas_salina.1
MVLKSARAEGAACGYRSPQRSCAAALPARARWIGGGAMEWLTECGADMAAGARARPRLAAPQGPSPSRTTPERWFGRRKRS